MGKQQKIYKHFLEDYIKDLRFNKRMTFKEIEKKLREDKNVSISRETIRRFLRNKIHEITRNNME